MKILHIITHYFPHVYGAENFAQHFAEYQATTGHTVQVLTGQWNQQWPKEETINQVNLYRVGVIRVRYIQTLLATLPFLWQAYRLHRKYRFETIHCHIYPGMIVGAILKAFRFQVSSFRFVATIQGGDIGDYPEVFGPFAGVAKPLIGWALKHADRVHCVSTYLRDEVIKMGVNRTKIVVVPNGVDVHKFKFQSSKFKIEEKNRSKEENTRTQKHKNKRNRSQRTEVKIQNLESRIERKNIRLISTSRLEAKNNLHQLIEVVNKLRDKGYNIILDIYGTGSLQANLESAICNLQLQNSIRLKGYADHDKLPSILPEYDIFIRLSTQEGFGISFIEAMACGVIPIGTPVGGIRDIIQNGVNGYLLKMTNDQLPMTNDKIAAQLTSIFQSSIHWDKIRQNARQTVQEKFAWDQVLTQVDQKLSINAS